MAFGRTPWIGNRNCDAIIRVSVTLSIDAIRPVGPYGRKAVAVLEKDKSVSETMAELRASYAD